MSKNHEIIEFTVTQVKEWLRELYNLDADVKPLVSYMDKNFLLTETGTGNRYIFKIANKESDLYFLDAQNKTLDYLNQHRPDLTFPRIIKSLDNTTMPQVTSHKDTQHHVRLLTYLPGTFLTDIPASNQSDQLLQNIGAYLGAMDHALASFHHPALLRHETWDLKNSAEMEARLHYINDHRVRTLVHYVIQRFKQKVLPNLSRLRQSVIQNDGNDHNVLVAEDHTTVNGLIDFGDMVYTCTVCEPAIAIAYALHGKEDPLKTASAIIKG